MPLYQMELIEVVLLVLLGAAVAYLLDAIFRITPWLAERIARVLGGSS